MPAPGTQAASPGGRRWDIRRLMADLDHESDEARTHAAANLQYLPPGMQEALTLLRTASSSSTERATFALAMLGSRLAPGEIEQFENAVQREPDDRLVRLIRLGYYSRARFQADAGRKAHQALVLWVIGHAPRSHIAGSPVAGLFPDGDGEAYEQAKRLWLGHVETHPDDTAILGNAASFLTISERATSGELLRRARALEPDNPVWSGRLGFLYELEMAL